jgi:hypothetical protein
MKMHPARSPVWLSAIGIALLAACVVGYYVSHKPFSSDLVLAVGRVGADVLIAGGILAVAGGLGRRWIPHSPSDPLARAALHGSLGLGAVSLVILAIGLIGELHAWVGWVVVIGLAVILRRDVLAWLCDVAEVRHALRQAGVFGWAVAACALVLLVVSAVEALAPPVHFDALVYHLSLPEEFLSQGSIAFGGSNPYWGMPLGAEMLYTWALSLGRAQTAALLGWMIGVLTLLGVLGVGRAFGPRGGWGGVAALLCGETISASLGWSYADWPAALHGLGVLIALLSWEERRDVATAALAGVLAGWAVGVKYSAALVVPAGVCVFLGRARLRESWRPALAFVGAGVLGCVPWLAKNLLYTGVALFPFFGRNPWVSPVSQSLYSGGALEVSLLEAVLTPVLATFRGIEGGPGYAASIGPLMLGLLPGALLVRRSRADRARLLVIFLAVGWTIWAVGSLASFKLIQSRLYFALFPAWGILAGAGYSGLARIRLRGVRVRRLTSALVVMVMILACLNNLQQMQAASPSAVILGLESQDDYLARRLGAYAPAMLAIGELGEDARVLALWEARGFHCQPGCLPDFWIDRWYVTWQAQGAVQRVVEAWRAMGVTHVLVHRAGAEFVRATDARYRPADWEGLSTTLEALQPVTSFGNGYELFEVPE